MCVGGKGKMGGEGRAQGMLILKDSLRTGDEQQPGQGGQVVIQGCQERRVGYWQFRSLFLLGSFLFFRSVDMVNSFFLEFMMNFGEEVIQGN